MIDREALKRERLAALMPVLFGDPIGPIHHPTRYDLQKLQLNAFMVEFEELMSRHQDVGFTMYEDGSIEANVGMASAVIR